MNDLLAGLNDRQKKAVTAPLGPVLVLAGAGSGKTRALTYRIAYLIRKKLFSPEEILALTFTNKAASEMRERIETLLGEHQTGLTMGTFHSVCARILRREAAKLRQSLTHNFVIYDSDDSLSLIKQIVLELGLGDKYRPQIFAYYISRAKNLLRDPKDIEIDNDYLQGKTAQIYEIYEERLRAHNALDFDDLLKLTCDLFSQNKTVLKEYQDKFRYILVDEYQDTNHAQYILLRLLVGKRKNIFVVGDDAQSIYGFRGANMQNILDFKKDYPKAKIVMLEQNYRSTQAILDVAHEVIKMNPFQYEKRLWTDRSGGEKVRLYEAADEQDESDFILRELLRGSEVREEVYDQTYEDSEEDNSILGRFARSSAIRARFAKAKWMRPRPTIRAVDLPEDLKETAVLYRTHAQSRSVEEAMLAAGVPYQVVGGIKFYERREIKDVLAYLRWLSNPRDLVSLSRVINLPARGIGPQGLKIITSALAEYNHDFRRLHNNIAEVDLSDKAQRGAIDFFGTFVAAADLPPQTSLTDIMDMVLARSGYRSALLQDRAEGQDRWENVQELFNVAGKYEQLPWQEGLTEFLEEVALMTDLDQVDEKTDKLTLMTLHSAKGLEFNKVFFVGLEEGLLPHSRSLLSPEEIAEEVRLAYVGITRARTDLYLSYARQRQVYGELKRSVPSRILKSIPKKLLQMIPRREDFQ